jgi:hypothetical protein
VLTLVAEQATVLMTGLAPGTCPVRTPTSLASGPGGGNGLVPARERVMPAGDASRRGSGCRRVGAGPHRARSR